MHGAAGVMILDDPLFCITMFRDMPGAVIYVHAKGRVYPWSAARTRDAPPRDRASRWAGRGSRVPAPSSSSRRTHAPQCGRGSSLRSSHSNPTKASAQAASANANTTGGSGSRNGRSSAVAICRVATVYIPNGNTAPQYSGS